MEAGEEGRGGGEGREGRGAVAEVSSSAGGGAGFQQNALVNHENLLCPPDLPG